ncbi:MAG TPA: M1 family aminopeptidase [Pyrinomonadaceae bacterium]|jgi:hypothetical protein|nr:M1 family aminopeptidase [Pyrinomonadaceae bacterium]
MKKRILLYFIALGSFVPSIFAQDPQPQETPRVVGEVTVTAKNANADPLYKELKVRSLEPGAFSDCVLVTNLTMKKDRGIFVFKGGEICFLAPVKGRHTGAVFIGDGEFHLTPPNETEKKSISIFIEAGEVNEQFTQLVMMFTDKTVEEIKNSPDAKAGGNAEGGVRARDLFRDKESLLKKQFRYNMSSRILADLYTPDRPGFFISFIDGKSYGKLVYAIDPLGIPEVYPEQVQLLSYAENTGGTWTAFHLQEEYSKGTANSWTDRRIYDITKHDLDTTIQGTKLIIKDVLTMQMRAANVQFIPFDLFRSLRVKSVRTEDNAEIDFIQESKDEDADFGVILPKAQEPGKPFKLTIEYEGSEALRLAGKGNYILLPRSTWYPNNPNTAFGDRAEFDLTFRYPKKFVLIATGNRVGTEEVAGDLKISKWSTEGTNLAVAGFNYGDFKETDVADDVTGLALEVFANRELPDEMKAIQVQVEQAESAGAVTGTTFGSMSTSAGAKVVLTEAQNAVRIYSNFFGKLPYKRVAMTQQPAGFFGQAWPTLVFMPYFAFMGDTHRTQLFGIRGGTDGFWREVAAHEVAHQWWGHTVGWTSYHDQWMSEGFAQFSTALFIQYVKKDVNKFNDFWEDQRKQIIEATPATKGKKPYTVGPVTQGYRLNTAKTGSIAQSMIYPKGAYILHMLRMMMFDHKGGTGDANFRKMMNDFIKTHYNQDVSTEDFKRIVEKHITPEMNVTGDGKMDWFFDSWVYGADIPEFKFDYTTSSGPDGKTIFNGKITQAGVSKDFVSLMPLYMDFGIGLKYIGRIAIKGNSTLEMNNIALPSAPKKVAVDAFKDILNTRISVNGK